MLRDDLALSRYPRSSLYERRRRRKLRRTELRTAITGRDEGFDTVPSGAQRRRPTEEGHGDELTSASGSTVTVTPCSMTLIP